MKKLIALIIIFLSGCEGNVQLREKSLVLGVGANTCDTFESAVDDGEDVYNYLAWSQGYLSALNAFGKSDMDIHAQFLMRRVLETCAQNNKGLFSEALSATVQIILEEVKLKSQ